jgi:signal transduction histidine kinase
MERTDRSPRRLPPRQAYRTMWSELGGFGRVMLIGVAAGIALVVVLGFLIPSQVEDHLIDVRLDTYANVADELSLLGLVPTGDPTEGQLSALGNAVKLKLLGGDAVRVKFWGPDGTIIYSDAPALIGRRFTHSDDLEIGFAGGTVVEIPDVSKPENLFERGLGPLREYYVPIFGPSGGVIAVFGVYENAERLDEAVTSTRRTVWLSLGIALGIFLFVMVSLTVANARIITRRAREAEDMADELARAREDERKRVIGALHDDIGQPLYRVLYGVRGARAVAPDTKLEDELARLEDLLLEIDGTLRSELKALHDETLQQLELDILLRSFVDRARDETGLDIDLSLHPHGKLPGMMRSAMFRAAREAVTNAWRHSGASHIALTVRNGGGRVVLEVRDDGSGVSGPPGLGLTTTRQRLETVGGGMDLRKDDSGTVFRAWVPVQLEEADT